MARGTGGAQATTDPMGAKAEADAAQAASRATLLRIVPTVELIELVEPLRDASGAFVRQGDPLYVVFVAKLHHANSTCTVLIFPQGEA